MPTIRQTFSGGIMDKDTDERLIPSGYYRHAENLNVLHSEGSDEGSVENILSNKKLTNLYFGSNVEVSGKYEDRAKGKLYWCVVSDLGSWVIEYDVNSNTTSKVLSDTRPLGSRVLNFKKGNSITTYKIVNEKDEDDLLLITDNNLEVLCFNIERAKSFAENGFDREDIYLIKKPPLYPANVHPLMLPMDSNDMEDNFFSFYYRYQYLDGEYSALSPGSKIVFNPKNYEPDYFELINKGMVNQYNAVRVSFNTGERQVKRVQVCFKKSNSNNIYLIESFDKEDEGWGDGEVHSITFMNNKIYTLLPEKELYRLFDNIPRRAKALSVMNNRVVLGDYVEGYNMVTKGGNKVIMDYSVSYKSYDVNNGVDLPVVILGPLFIFSSVDGLELKRGSSIVISMNVVIENISVYRNSFQLIFSEDYDNLFELVDSVEFQNLTSFINLDFKSRYNENGDWVIPPHYTLVKEPEISFQVDGNNLGFRLSEIEFSDTNNDGNPVVFQPTFSSDVWGSPVSVFNYGGNDSCKSHRNYSVGIVYRDDFGRSSTVQTTDKNTVFIPQNRAENKNVLTVSINHEAPYWATNYKLAIKANPLSYQIIYANTFYAEGIYTWVKLEDGNKDKVKSGDFLIVKVASGAVLPEPVRVKVLDVEAKESDFITGNVGEGGNEIIESSGLYMKIKPSGFSMNQLDYKTYIDDKYSETSGRATIFLNLFSTTEEPLALPKGSYIKIRLHSNRKYKSGGWHDVEYEREFYVTSDYSDIKDWVEDYITNVPSLYFNRKIGGNTETPLDLAEYVSLSDGVPLPGSNTTIIADGWHLKFRSPYTGNSGGAKSRATGEIYIRIGGGMYVFETIVKEVDNEVYYETPETYPIVNGNHLALIDSGLNNEDQDLMSGVPAKIELSFFNCFSHGNGVESYRIYDDFNTNFLNIDSRPNLVSVEPFREIHRYADVTYGEPYLENVNINGLNEFNASMANWKELNKQDGAIQILHERDGNLLVVQEHKWGYIMFGKDALYSPDGSFNLQRIPEVLGGYVPYAGVWGLSDVESFAVDGNRCYGVDKERGVVLRLSMNGLTPIVRGMKSFFRDVFHRNKNSRVIGGIDPYSRRYQITIDEEPENLLKLKCGNEISKHNQSSTFIYELHLNNLVGEVELIYNITDGLANIVLEHGNDVHETGEVSGAGVLSFDRTDLSENKVKVMVIPISETVSYSIENKCPKGLKAQVVTIVLNDPDSSGKQITNRYKWGDSHFYSGDDLFTDEPYARWNVSEGVEGHGPFPSSGSVVTMESYKDISSTLDFGLGNRLLYAVSPLVYEPKDIEQLLSEAEVLRFKDTVKDNGLTRVVSGSFLFEKSSEDDILYMIWDYRKPKV